MNAELLENKVDGIAEELEINPDSWQKFRGIMIRLKEYDLPSYMHCLRVGIYSHGVAKAEGFVDIELAFWGGCAHDLGKSEVPLEALTGDWTGEWLAKMKSHPRKGFEALKDEFLFVALIAGLHHKFSGSLGYGIDLIADCPQILTAEDKRRITETTKVVTISDFFDAMTTRNNRDWFFDPKSPVERAGVMRRFFDNQSHRITYLIENPIE